MFHNLHMFTEIFTVINIIILVPLMILLPMLYICIKEYRQEKKLTRKSFITFVLWMVLILIPGSFLVWTDYNLIPKTSMFIEPSSDRYISYLFSPPGIRVLFPMIIFIYDLLYIWLLKNKIFNNSTYTKS